MDSDTYGDRLERLVRRLIGVRFKGGDGLWRLQVDLLDLQREIQASISAEKSSTQTREPSEELEALRLLRFHARRFGDAFAWLLLGLDRQLIHPLGENDPVAILPDDDSAKGMIGMAVGLAQKGWGFPLLHDVTDCLRIGDVTFIKPDHDPVTVEIKSTVVSESVTDDNTREITFTATATSAILPPDLPEPTNAGPGLASTDGRRPRFDTRAERQFRRLTVAHTHQTAEAGSVTDVAGQPLVTAQVDREPSHFHEVQRIARKARRSGYGAVAIEQTFLYAAIFDEDGLSADRLDDAFNQLSADLLSSDILFEDEPEDNTLLIMTVPDEPWTRTKYHLPYLLLDLPHNTVVDLLRGRMMLLNLVNSGRVVRALEDNGYQVDLPTGRNDLSSGSIVVSAQIEHDSRGLFMMEMHNLQRYIEQMILEFRPLASLLSVVEGVRETAHLGIDHSEPPSN